MTNDRDFSASKLTLAVAAGDAQALYELIAQQLKTQKEIGKTVAFLFPDNFIGDAQMFADTGAAMLEYTHDGNDLAVAYALRGMSYNYIVAVLQPAFSNSPQLEGALHNCVASSAGVVITYLVGKR